MSAVLDSAGVSGDIAKNNVILINNCQQFAWALFGATLVDRFGRRPLLLFANLGCSLVWMCITITSSEFAKHGGTATDPGTSPAAGTATLAFIFVFGAVFSIGFSPLQALYPVEVLSFEMRAKGMAFQNLAMNAAMLLNQFAWPVSMDKITWRTYIIFCIWCAIQATVIFFFIPETKNCTVRIDILSWRSALLLTLYSSRKSIRSSTIQVRSSIRFRSTSWASALTEMSLSLWSRR